MKKVLIIYLILLPIMVFSQKYTISGYIKDTTSGEQLIGATVIMVGTNIGAFTNSYGFYSITLEKGMYVIEYSYLGFSQKRITINLSNNITQNIELSPVAEKIETVVVTSEALNKNISSTRMGEQNLQMQELKAIPVLFGENDVLKTIQLMPGVKSAGEGSCGFFVRGGGADQNLILLDEATVYNASHLLGFFSVFNGDAIKDVKLYKGAMPAEYGGRLSSVLDIKMNDGNDKKIGVSGGIGLISSRITIDGPIVKNKGSFIISGRRTYADQFLKLLQDSTLKQTKLYFYDLNVKANYQINDKNKIYLSGYFGKDALGISSYGINWGNSTATIRWNHLLSSRLFSNTSAVFSNYYYTINIESGQEMNIISRIQDYGLKQDFIFYAKSNNTIKFGFNSIYHKIIPGIISLNSNPDFENLSNKYSWENSIYFSQQYKLSDKISFEYGTRLSIFSLLGPGNFYTYNQNGSITDTLSYKSNEFVKTFVNLEPRGTFNYLINSKSSIKGSYTRNVQNLHLLSNSTSGNPTDMWITSSNNVKPEIADQISIGYYRNFNENKFEFSTEIYYKNLQNQIDYKNGAEINFNENVESQILFGKGRAYGWELYFKKKYGDFNGWISYTLSRSERKFEGINNGNYYAAKQDRTHDISIVGMYKLNDRWSLSSTFVYYTGNAVTFPSGKYSIDGKTMFLYGERNADRMPVYHRLDIGATWITKKTDSFESSWNFSLYNAYGHQNAYSISFQENESDPTKTEAVQTSLFRFIPSFTYNFKF